VLNLFEEGNMSKEHPFILYAGPVEGGQLLSAAAERRGWYVLLPEDDLEAMAMYSVCYPDVSIIDRGVNFADEVEFHLRSIAAPLIALEQNLPLQYANPQAILDTVAAFLKSLPVEHRETAWTVGTVFI
jgi:hypothetical protein